MNIEIDLFSYKCVSIILCLSVFNKYLEINVDFIKKIVSLPNMMFDMYIVLILRIN